MLIRTNLDGLAWELLHDGDNFWGLTFALGTHPTSPIGEYTATSPGPAPLRPTRPRVLLIGSDPEGDLGFVAAEIAALLQTLDAHADVHCVNGALATFDAVTCRLA